MPVRVAEVSQPTKGRPQPVAAPDDGWTWQHVSELPAGSYRVTLVPDDGTAHAGDDNMPAGPVIEILARSAGAWDRQVTSLLVTVEKQQKLIGELYAQIAKLQEQSPADPASQLGNILGIVKGLLPAPQQPALPTANGQ